MDKTVLLLLCLQVVLLITAFPSDAAGQVIVKGPDQVKRSATAIKKVGIHTFNYLSEFTTNSILYFVERGTLKKKRLMPQKRKLAVLGCINRPGSRGWQMCLILSVFLLFHYKIGM